MSRIYNIDFDLPSSEVLPAADDDSEPEFHTSCDEAVDGRSLSLQFDLEDFWTPLRWQSAEPPVKILNGSGKKAPSSASVDLIGLFDPPTGQQEDRSNLCKDTVEMWFPRHPLTQQMPMPVEPPLSLPVSITSCRRAPLPRLDESLIPVICPYDGQRYSLLGNQDLGLDLDVLSPLRGNKGLDITSFHRIIEETLTSSSSSMWRGVNPVYRVMTSLKFLIDGVASCIAPEEVRLCKSPTIVKRRIAQAARVEGLDDADGCATNATKKRKTLDAASSLDHRDHPETPVCTWMDDDSDTCTGHSSCYPSSLLEANTQPRYFDYEDTMTGIPYTSLADEIGEMHPLISEVSSSSSSSGIFDSDIEAALEEPPCSTLVPYHVPPVPIGGWAMDYLPLTVPRMISRATGSSLSTSSSSDDSSTIAVPSEDETPLTVDDEIISDMSIESEESLYIAESTDTDDPDASLECMTEVSECASSFTEAPREPLKLTPIAGRIEIGSSSGNSGGYAAQRNRQDLLKSMAVWLSEMALERERQAMAVCDRPKPPPAESCTQIQLYRGAQVDMPAELRYRGVGVEIGFQSSACNEFIPAFCMENILTLPDSQRLANGTGLPVLGCTDLEIFEPRRLAIPAPLGYGDDELDMEDLDCDTEQSEFDDEWSIIGDDAFYSEVDSSFVLLG
ncbi:hypothetical protein FOZ61_008112 [Perkinsus olseni]|uniref:Uncharacterized protein n=1 Tax=Perkinsus olseni TaxID=32597 RepID=A0A7J6M7K9_PEROL|nr:hypothetical protein FOZ61_008112 [Perkinsus olseni]